MSAVRAAWNGRRGDQGRHVAAHPEARFPRETRWARQARDLRSWAAWDVPSRSRSHSSVPQPCSRQRTDDASDGAGGIGSYCGNPNGASSGSCVANAAACLEGTPCNESHPFVLDYCGPCVTGLTCCIILEGPDEGPAMAADGGG